MELKIVWEQDKVPEERAGREANGCTQNELVLNYGCERALG